MVAVPPAFVLDVGLIADRGWVVVASVVVCFATWFVIERTRLGATLRAATENPALVQAFGINVPLLITLTYAGGVAPPVAWNLVREGQAILVDVRSAEERKFVGHVPGSLHVAWATGTALTRNPRFVRELEAKLVKDGGKDAVVLLLCRSGRRSVLAAEAAAAAGFRHVFNVLEGFEGEVVPASTPAPPPTIGFLARLCPQKGLDLVVDAFIELHRSGRHPGARLCCLGAMTAEDARFVRQLEARLEKAGCRSAVEFHPNVSRERKIELLRTLTLLSVPTDSTVVDVSLGGLGSYRAVGASTDDGTVITAMPTAGADATVRRYVMVEATVALVGLVVLGVVGLLTD